MKPPVITSIHYSIDSISLLQHLNLKSPVRRPQLGPTLLSLICLLSTLSTVMNVRLLHEWLQMSIRVTRAEANAAAYRAHIEEMNTTIYGKTATNAFICRLRPKVQMEEELAASLTDEQQMVPRLTRLLLSRELPFH